MEEQRLLLDYQEIVPLDGRREDGARVELLLRLRDEDGRIVLPGAFLPAAERYGLMPMVDRWVIRAALTHFDQLHADGRALQQCAINLSGASIEDEDLADFIWRWWPSTGFRRRGCASRSPKRWRSATCSRWCT